MARELTAVEFVTDVEQGTGLAIVDFYATWCQPCKIIVPMLDELAEKYEGQVGIYKLNVEEAVTLAQKYQIQTLPTLLFFRDGFPVGGIVRAVRRPKVEMMIQDLLR